MAFVRRGRTTLALVALSFALLAAPVLAADQALIDAAKKEGVATWYTTLIINQFTRPAAEAFEKKYGIKVEYIRADPNEIALRISNEAKAGKVLADIFDGFGMPALVRAGFVEKWIPDTAKRLPQQFWDPNHYWAAPNLFALTPGYNTDLVKKGTEPKTFEDLLDPKWKGKLAWNIQPSISAGQGFAGSVLIAMGEAKARTYLAALAKQNITPLKVSGRQVLDLVISGEYPIGLQIFNNHALISSAKGAPVDWIAMQPPLVTYSVMSVLKDAPEPNAGKLLVDYIVSEEGQKIFADAGELPVRPNVKPRDPAMIPDGVAFKGTFLTPEQLNRDLPAWSRLFDEYFK